MCQTVECKLKELTYSKIFTIKAIKMPYDVLSPIKFFSPTKVQMYFLM